MVDVLSSDLLNSELNGFKSQSTNWNLSCDEKLVNYLSKFSSYLQTRTRDIVEKV